MDFVTTASPSVVIKINGTSYSVPRFLRDDMAEYAAAREKEIADKATAHLNDDDKARFLIYFQPPPIDTLELSERLRTPEGVGYVLNRQLALAKVPAETVAEFLKNVDARRQRGLADLICSSRLADAAASTGSQEPPKGEQGATVPLGEQPPT